MRLGALSLECSERLAHSGARTIARVSEGESSIDLAVALPAAGLAVVRCVDQPTPQDHAALATMVAEGDFAWAGLVYSDQLHAGWPGPIEAFHVSELPQLIQRLQELQRAATS